MSAGITGAKEFDKVVIPSKSSTYIHPSKVSSTLKKTTKQLVKFLKFIDWYFHVEAPPQIIQSAEI